MRVNLKWPLGNHVRQPFEAGAHGTANKDLFGNRLAKCKQKLTLLKYTRLCRIGGIS